MESQQYAMPEGGAVTVPSEPMSTFADAFRGELVTPADPAYDQARSIWNGMIDRRPALIARCRGEADVAEGVALAREHGLRFSIRSVGHNIAGCAIWDGGLVLDLGMMNGVRVDPDERTARVGPGADWGDLDR